MAIQIYLRPGASELFAEPHSRMRGYGELGQALSEPPGDHCAYLAVFVDQLCQDDHFVVAQFGRLSPLYGISLKRLVHFDSVRLAPGLLPVPLTRRIVVNPSDRTALRVLEYSAH